LKRQLELDFENILWFWLEVYKIVFLFYLFFQSGLRATKVFFCFQLTMYMLYLFSDDFTEHVFCKVFIVLKFVRNSNFEICVRTILKCCAILFKKLSMTWIEKTTTAYWLIQLSNKKLSDQNAFLRLSKKNYDKSHLKARRENFFVLIERKLFLRFFMTSKRRGVKYENKK
jgi:hypothetical protein